MGGSRAWTEATLPFERLSAADFERFCCALLAAEGHREVRHWGAAGSEKGCDLVSIDPDGRRVVTQCKRVGSLGPRDAETEVRKVLDEPPSPPPDAYALIATCALSRATEERLEQTVGDAFGVELCGLTDLDRRVRRHADLVDWFFGAAIRSTVEPPLWWLSAASADREWAEAFAEDLGACLRLRHPEARVELGIPSGETPWPEVPSQARWGLVVVTPEALADDRLRQIWRGALCQPCRSGGRRRRLALALEPTPWPPWLEERFERADMRKNEYRIDLAKIISKYIGSIEKDLPSRLCGPGPLSRRLDAGIRERLVRWLEPVMSRRPLWRLLASALGLEHRKALDDFETPALRASAALVLAAGADDPVEAALRVLEILRDELEEESTERLRALDELARELQRSRTALTEREGLLAAWLRQVRSDHRRLVDHFQQRYELDLLDRVYVELEMAPDQQERIEPTMERDPLSRRAWTIRELLELEPHTHPWVTRRWIVRGDPGSGKTTLLRHLAAGLAAESSPRWVPVFQSLPVLIRDGRPLLDRLERSLGRAERQGLGRVLDRLGEEARLLVLLDGLDEVGMEERQDAETLIRQLADRWPETPVVVTTRPIGYRRFSGAFHELQLQPLDRERRHEFLARWFGRFEGTSDEARAGKALQELDGPGFEELAGNPLYLTLMALLLEDGESPSRNRAKLYDQVFDLLLEGKHKLGVRDGSFEKIDRPELVRRTLRRLAETMTLDNRDAEPRRQLEERLYRDELERERDEMRKVHRWDGKLPCFLDDVAEKVGVLGPHDGEDADWRFWHRTFREALAAERMVAWPAERLLEHARAVEGQESRWAEPFALLCGQVDDADALLRRLLEANRPLALRALATAQSVSDGTVEEVLELTGDWEDRSKVFEKLPELIGDADRCLRLIDRLRRGRRDGNDLYFLDHAAWRVAREWPDFSDDVWRLRNRLYDHIPPPDDPRVLLSWNRPDGREEDLWCRVPAGVGWVGKRDDEEGQDRESQRHQVRVRQPFWLSAIPVTNLLYAAFDDAKPFYPWEGVPGELLTHHPRVGVTWYEAVSFCRWLATQLGFEGSSPTLPEEEAWEYACRAGSETRFWSGDEEKNLAVTAWYRANSNHCTHHVGEKKANPWGLYDLHGNVWEWVATKWDEGRYQGRSSEEPHSIVPGASLADLTAPHRVRRVVRGGSYWLSAQRCRAAYRSSGAPGFVLEGLGFRVLLSSAPSRH